MKGFKSRCDWYVHVYDVNTGECLDGIHLFGEDICDLPQYIDRWLRRYSDIPKDGFGPTIMVRISDH